MTGEDVGALWHSWHRPPHPLRSSSPWILAVFAKKQGYFGVLGGEKAWRAKPRLAVGHCRMACICFAGAMDQEWSPAEGSKGAQPSAVLQSNVQQQSLMHSSRVLVSGIGVQLQQILDECDQDWDAQTPCFSPQPPRSSAHSADRCTRALRPPGTSQPPWPMPAPARLCPPQQQQAPQPPVQSLWAAPASSRSDLHQPQRASHRRIMTTPPPITSVPGEGLVPVH